MGIVPIREEMEMRPILTKEGRIEIARKFAEEVITEFNDWIKAIVLVGSVVREEFRPMSDIDIVIIIDDTKEEFSEEFLEKVYEELEKIADSIEEAKVKIEELYDNELNLISVHLYTLTEFWDCARVGHPLIYNYIKEGIVLYDVGFFRPIQRLWERGKIPTTREAIEKYLEDASKRIARAKTVKLLQLTEDCYYAIVNSAQAILMCLGKQPPAPSRLYEEFKKALVDPGLVDSEYAEWIREIVEIRKMIEYQELREVKGDFIDMWIRRTERFVAKMHMLLGMIEIMRTEKVILKTYEVMLKAIARALSEMTGKIKEYKGVEEMLADNEQIDEDTLTSLKQAFKEKFIDAGLIDPAYLKIWDKVIELRNIIMNREYDETDLEEVYEMRKAVRLLLHELERALRKKEKLRPHKRSKKA